MEEQYISEIVNLDDIKENCINLIYAPPGSGKTYFAINVIAKHNFFGWGERCAIDYNDNILYLIDSRIGKDQLLAQNAEIEYNKFSGEEYYKINNVYLMTYAGYATLINNNPKDNNKWNVIVCDEFHNCISWSKWESKGLHKQALKLIGDKVVEGLNNGKSNVIIALTATPDMVKKEVSPHYINEIKLLGTPRQYINKETKYYNNISILLNEIKQGEKGIIYIGHIKEIRNYCNLLQNKGIKAEGFWSINNENRMTDKQLELRQYIIDNEEIPNNIDILFINESSATGINIRTKLNFMIIHDSNRDKQIQVRGRNRSDLQLLYLKKEDAKIVIDVPDGYLDKKLFKDDVNSLVEHINIRKNWALMKKNTVFDVLKKQGNYLLQHKRERQGENINKTYYIISKKSN